MAYQWNLFLILSLSVTLFCISSLVGAKLQSEVELTTDMHQRPLPTNEQEQCVPFHHYYCSKFGYNQTISPNPWARDLTLEQAIHEFGDFADLLRRNCSEKLGTFLCFTYFPLCYKQPLAGVRKLVLPCRETCDIVHNSECNDLVLGSVGEWGKHLQCANFHTKAETENGNCADGQQEEWTDTTIEGKGKDGDKKDTITSTAPSPVNQETRDNCKVHKCQNICSVRERCTARALQSNHYKFLAKVLVLHKLDNPSHCKHAYQVEVVEQFNISSRPLNSKQPHHGPAMQNHCIIHTSPSNCPECPTLTTGSTYLIGGQCHTAKDGAMIWELPNGRMQSLVSEWKDVNGEDYDKKLQKWITRAKLQKDAN